MLRPRSLPNGQRWRIASCRELVATERRQIRGKMSRLRTDRAHSTDQGPPARHAERAAHAPRSRQVSHRWSGARPFLGSPVRSARAMLFQGTGASTQGTTMRDGQRCRFSVGADDEAKTIDLNVEAKTIERNVEAKTIERNVEAKTIEQDVHGGRR